MQTISPCKRPSEDASSNTSALLKVERQLHTKRKRTTGPEAINKLMSANSSNLATGDNSTSRPQELIDYSDIKEFIRQQETNPKPLTPQQLSAIWLLKHAIRSGKPDLGGKDWVSLLLRMSTSCIRDVQHAEGTCTANNIAGYRDAHQKSGCSVIFTDLSAPNNTWACRCQIQLSQDSIALTFPVSSGREVQGFSRKKDAKQYAAKCCVEWCEMFLPPACLGLLSAVSF